MATGGDKGVKPENPAFYGPFRQKGLKIKGLGKFLYDFTQLSC
jgi:hypothetical protein